MTDDNTAAPRAKAWLRYLGAATLLAVAYVGYTAWSAEPGRKVGFDMTAHLSEESVTIGGAVGIADDTFEFNGTRISFSGRIEGDRVSIEGQMVSGDRATTASFKGGGAIVEGRSSVAVKSPQGNRLGTLKLDFNPA